MANSFWNFATRMVAGTLAKAADVNTNFDGVAAGFTLVEADIDAISYTIVNEGSDATTFILFSADATGALAPLSNANLTFDAFTGTLGATFLTGALDGILGGNTPAAATVTTFTSTGIDDNATAERVQIADASMQFGSAVSASQYSMTRAENTGLLDINGGSGSGAGANILFYGGSHASKANDMTIRAGTTAWLAWDESAGTMYFYTDAGAKTLALTLESNQDATFAGDVGAVTGTFSGIVSVDDTTDSTSTTTGSIHTDGGLGVAKDAFFGADVNIATSLNVEAYSEDADQYTATTGTRDLDTALATYFYPSADLGTATITFTFSNPASSGRVSSFTLELLGADGATLSWPAGVVWSGGIVPTWSSGLDIISFTTRDAGTTWLGFVGGQAFA